MNAFIALCNFEENVKTMEFINCNLFKRSFTNKGLGYSFNNEIERNLIKEKFRDVAFYPNKKRNPTLMTSANSQHALRVVLDSNDEEVKRYEKNYEIKKNPKKVSVAIHNPMEPADLRSSSFKIPLGHSTEVYVTPKAREIDESGRGLTEAERNCRLSDNTKELDVFNVYTQTACLFECKMKYAKSKCGCLPWNYPSNKYVQVSIKSY